MINIKLTEEQLDDLKTILDYVCEITSENYQDCVDIGDSEETLKDHTYRIANELRGVTWEKA